MNLDTERWKAVLFDLDGVLTQTAKLHAAAWKEMFDAYLRERGARTGEQFREFDIATDYKRYIDGKLRQDGVRSFLASRGIQLPEGSPDDPPGRETIHGLGNRKNELVLQLIRTRGVDLYDSSIAWARWLKEHGVKTAVVSASRNCRTVLEKTGIADLFDVVVDGEVAHEKGLAGKPSPATFLEAARRLGVAPEQAIVVEDAVSGVEAGRRGGFGLVIGVDRKGDPEALRSAGAHLVVQDLAELISGNDSRRTMIDSDR